MSLSLALRNLMRNRWRTGLTAGGVAMAVSVVIWMAHLMGGMLHVMSQSVTAVELGDAQIHSAAYVGERSLYNAFPTEAARLDAVRAVPGVKGASARVLAYGLVGHEKHSQVARIVGVDPDAERQVTRIPERVAEGRWLGPPPEPPAPREVVLGKTLADQLKVKVGGELVVLLQAANGSLGNDALKIVGVARTGNATLDRSAVWMHVADVQWLTALDGRAHEIAIAAPDTVTQLGVLLADDAGRGAVRDAAKVALGPQLSKLEALTWDEAMPELVGFIEIDKNSGALFGVLIFLVVAFGIANTFLMSVLERVRELGLLAALGLTPNRVARLVVVEAALLGAVSIAAGVAIGYGLHLWIASVGIDWSEFTGGEMEISGVVLEDMIIYSKVELSRWVNTVIAVFVLIIVSALYPAWRATRMDPAAAMRTYT